MRYRALPLLLLFGVAVLVFQHAKDFSFSSLSPDTLRIGAEDARRQRFALILDIRTPQEREEFGFYPNSMPLPPSQLAEEVPYLLGDKPGRPRKAPLLVYSNAGDGRAKKAAQILYDLGYVGTRYMEGSYLDMLPPGQTTPSS